MKTVKVNKIVKISKKRNNITPWDNYGDQGVGEILEGIKISSKNDEIDPDPPRERPPSRRESKKTLFSRFSSIRSRSRSKSRKSNRKFNSNPDDSNLPNLNNDSIKCNCFKLNCFQSLSDNEVEMDSKIQENTIETIH